MLHGGARASKRLGCAGWPVKLGRACSGPWRLLLIPATTIYSHACRKRAGAAAGVLGPHHEHAHAGGRGAKGAAQRLARPLRLFCDSPTFRGSSDGAREGGGTGHWRPRALQELPQAVSAPWRRLQPAGSTGAPPGAAGPGAMPRRHAAPTALLAGGGDAACRPAASSSGLAAGERTPPRAAAASSSTRAADGCLEGGQAEASRVLRNWHGRCRCRPSRRPPAVRIWPTLLPCSACRSGLWALKKKNGGKFPVHPKQEKAAAEASKKPAKFYPAGAHGVSTLLALLQCCVCAVLAASGCMCCKLGVRWRCMQSACLGCMCGGSRRRRRAAGQRNRRVALARSGQQQQEQNVAAASHGRAGQIGGLCHPGWLGLQQMHTALAPQLDRQPCSKAHRIRLMEPAARAASSWTVTAGKQLDRCS